MWFDSQTAALGLIHRAFTCEVEYLSRRLFLNVLKDTSRLFNCIILIGTRSIGTVWVLILIQYQVDL